MIDLLTLLSIVQEIAQEVAQEDPEHIDHDFIITTLGGVITVLASAIVILWRAQTKTLTKHADKAVTALVLTTKSMDETVEWMKSIDTRLQANKDLYAPKLTKILEGVSTIKSKLNT